MKIKNLRVGYRPRYSTSQLESLTRLGLTTLLTQKNNFFLTDNKNEDKCNWLNKIKRKKMLCKVTHLKNII
jgi:hypothetical protein